MTRPDRRFRRASAKPARRRRALGARVRQALRAVTAVAAAAVCYAAADAIVRAPMLQITRVVVQGNHRLSTGEILALLDGMRGTNILRVRLDHWQTRLRTSPWIKDAVLRRVLPSTVEVAIWERTPMGIARIGSKLYLVDESGVIVDEYSAQYDQFDLPILDGLTVTRDGAPVVDERRAGLAARLLRDISQQKDLGRRVSQIDVGDDRNAVVLLDGDTALVHVGDEDFSGRLRAYLEMAEALRQRVPEIDYVDLRFGERVYVRPVDGTAKRLTRPAAARR